MALDVIIIASPQFGGAHVGYLSKKELEWTQDSRATPAENLVEFAGRMCYLSFGTGRQSPATNAEYIHKLIRNGHDSVLEHASWTIIFAGVSRSFTHQLVRHRIGFSFSQLSQQYHDETDAEFVQPPGLEDVPELQRDWTETVGKLREIYRELLDTASGGEKMPPREALRLRRSIARSVLPNATETAIVVTANARALRHFLEVRGAIVGDLEMRLVSQKLLLQLKNEAPALFVDFIEALQDDGWPIVKKVAVTQGADARRK